MSQIEIKILKQGTEHKKVISACFFTMKDAYRNFERYITSLKIFLNEVDKSRPDFCVRIYTDDSAKDTLLELIEPYPQVSIYHFNFPPLREGAAGRPTT